MFVFKDFHSIFVFEVFECFQMLLNGLKILRAYEAFSIFEILFVVFVDKNILAFFKAYRILCDKFVESNTLFITSFTLII